MKPGIYQIPESEYHADPCPEPSLSSSVASVLVRQSPLHARMMHPRLNPNAAQQNSKAKNTGSALHDLILGGGEKIVEIKVEKYSTNASREARDAALECGLIPMKTAELEAAKRIASRIQYARDVPAPFSHGRPEVTLIWREPCGVWCRARPDWLRDDLSCIDDLKKTQNARPDMSPGAFGRSVYAYGYDVQAALYLRGLKAITGAEARFRFVALEEFGPGASVSELSIRGRAAADAKVERAICQWAECLRENRWECYPGYSVAIEPPDWELAQMEAEECF